MGLFNKQQEQRATHTAPERRVTVTHSFTPDSEVIDAVLYDAKNRELYVLLHNGSLSGYKEVYKEDYDDFAEASSAGRFWNKEIKSHFKGINTDGIVFVNESEADVDVPEEELEAASQTYEFDTQRSPVGLALFLPVDLKVVAAKEYLNFIERFLEENEQEIARRFFESA